MESRRSEDESITRIPFIESFSGRDPSSLDLKQTRLLRHPEENRDIIAARAKKAQSVSDAIPDAGDKRE